jgi:hypothetical protein
LNDLKLRKNKSLSDNKSPIEDFFGNENVKTSPPRLPLFGKQRNDTFDPIAEEEKRRDVNTSDEIDPGLLVLANLKAKSILEDRYKPEGTVQLDIDRFSDFARGLPAENAQRLSEPVFIRGMPWKILGK